MAQWQVATAGFLGPVGDQLGSHSLTAFQVLALILPSECGTQQDRDMENPVAGEGQALTPLVDLDSQVRSAWLPLDCEIPIPGFRAAVGDMLGIWELNSHYWSCTK